MIQSSNLTTNVVDRINESKDLILHEFSEYRLPNGGSFDLSYDPDEFNSFSHEEKLQKIYMDIHKLLKPDVQYADLKFEFWFSHDFYEYRAKIRFRSTKATGNELGSGYNPLNKNKS